MASQPGPKTYRVRNIPGHLDRYQVVQLLFTLEPSIGSEDNVRVYSLAETLNPWEAQPTKVATVMFDRTPSAFEGPENQWTLPATRAGHEKDVLVDTHFLDFTLLSEPKNRDDYVNCISISGLASHPFGSWKEKSQASSFMWLRDRLPHDFPNARVILYGYDSKLVKSKSRKNIDDIALRLIHQMRGFGLSSPSTKPIFFLAHSLGGLALQRALVLLAGSASTFRFMLDKVTHILFFGVPCQGMSISHLIPMVDGQPNSNLVSSLSPGSDHIKLLKDQFGGLMKLQNVKIISAYESEESPIPTSINGKWERRLSGPCELLVDKKSATHFSCQLMDQIPLEGDHYTLVKFSDGDANYLAILPNLSEAFKCPQVSQSSVGLDYVRRVESIVKQHGDGIINAGTLVTREDLLRKFMNTIFLKEHDYRFSDVDNAIDGTFHWIFRDLNLGFVSWLEGRRGQYFWVSGKPGAGKSTLMKYICSASETQSKISGRESQGVRQIFAKYFFHDRGTHEQKSMEGLLQTLLYEILQKVPELKQPISELCKKSDPERVFFDISINNLRRAFRYIADQSIVSIDIWLFLDALDEFDGSTDIVVAFIRDLSKQSTQSKTRIYACFSSRPWNIFNDAFCRFPGIRIQDHTTEDMRKFCINKVEEDVAMTECFRACNGEMHVDGLRFVEAIVGKAQGVFLWVSLSMVELRRACTDGARFSDLAGILENLPQELEDFYARILARIPQEHREECFYMLEVVLRSEKPLTPTAFEEVVLCSNAASIGECIVRIRSFLEETKKEHKLRKEARFVRRIVARCGGLLELKKSRVIFMHQTVKDMVASPEFRQKLFAGTNINFAENGNSVLFKRKLIALMVPIGSKWVSNPINRSKSSPKTSTIAQFKECMMFASKAEKTTGIAQNVFIDSIDNHSYWSTQVRSLEPSPLNSGMTCAGAAGLELYIIEKMKHRQPRNSSFGDMLLASAAWGISHLRINSPDAYLEIVRYLVTSQANVTNQHMGKTAFQWLLHRLPLDQSEIHDTDEFFKLSSLFIESGQDPNVEIQAYASDERRVLTQCKAMHFMHPPLMQTLLDHGANIDAPDSDGSTPMDKCISVLHEPSFAKFFLNARDCLLLLVRAGGCIMTSDRLDLERAVHKLQLHGVSDLKEIRELGCFIPE